jgi:ABC-type uncharacterized transport system fused permease/ATPase subunit
MVYKRHIKRGNKLYGPYYYESYRDKNGKVVSKYLPDYISPKKHKKLLLFLGLIFVVFLFLAITNLNSFLRTTGKATQELIIDFAENFEWLSLLSPNSSRILIIILLIFIIILGLWIINFLIKRRLFKGFKVNLKKEYKNYYKFDKLKK